MASENIDIVVANDLMSGKLISFCCCSCSLLKKYLVLHVIESSLSVLLLFLIDLDCNCDEILWLCVVWLVKANPLTEMNSSVVAVTCREDNLIVYYLRATQYVVVKKLL